MQLRLNDENAARAKHLGQTREFPPRVAEMLNHLGTGDEIKDIVKRFRLRKKERIPLRHVKPACFKLRREGRTGAAAKIQTSRPRLHPAHDLIESGLKKSQIPWIRRMILMILVVAPLVFRLKERGRITKDQITAVAVEIPPLPRRPPASLVGKECVSGT